MPRAGSVQLAAYDEANSDARTRSVSIANAVPPPIEFTIYENLSNVEGDWRAFEQQADCTVFQTFDWLSTWQRHIGARGGVRPAIIVGRAGGEVLLILPLATQKIAFARELVWLGSDLCDYNAPLLAPRFSSSLGTRQFHEVWQHIVATLRSRPRLSYDLVRLEKMPGDVGSQPNPMLTLGVTANPSGAYRTPLTAPWEAFYTAKRSSATRRRDRTKRRRLAELGALALVHPDDNSEMLAALDTLMAQKSRALLEMGAGNLFARPGYADFYRALATDPRTKPLVHVSELNCGPQVAAVNLGLTFRGTYYHLLASHAAGELSRFGPGAAHLHDLLRHAIDRGCEIFDFTIGDEPYKRDWCDSPQKLYDHLSVATWRGIFVFVPAFAKSWFKRQIKQTPVLWKAFSRARKFYGSLMHRAPMSKSEASRGEKG